VYVYGRRGRKGRRDGKEKKRRRRIRRIGCGLQGRAGRGKKTSGGQMLWFKAVVPPRGD
jgi:hypothetical protein